MDSPLPSLTPSGRATPVILEDDFDDLQEDGTESEDPALNSDFDEDLPKDEASVAVSDPSQEDDNDAASTLAKLLKGKEKEWSSVAEKKGRLQLLDLPVDILREVINHVCLPNSYPPSCRPLTSTLASPHERLDFTSPYPLGVPQSGHTLHLLSFRHCMARFKYTLRAANGRRRAYLWPVHLGYG
jgi:hypothetical protein